jgi:hypothetical protein
MTEEWEECKRLHSTQHKLNEEELLATPAFTTATFATYEEGQYICFAL